MKLSFLLLLSFIAQSLIGQDNFNIQSSKYSASLKLFLASELKDKHFIEIKNGIQYVPLFVEMEPGFNNAALLVKAGIEVRTVAGSIVTANVPFNKLSAIASMSIIKRLELPLLFRSNSDTLMKKFTTVNKVFAGMPPLAMPYTGKGVVIGIIDDGIEFGHPYFLDSAGNTTINAIWNMDYLGSPPAGFNYGTLWEMDTLNYFLKPGYNLASPYLMQQKFGGANHGTSVASLAAGINGVAPDAMLVAVALNSFQDTLLRSDRIIDGIAFIYNRASALGKKCIINLSLGTQWGGPHDGKTLVERAIDNFCEDRADLLICSSVGNDGNNWKHWGGFPIHADSSFGFARFSYAGSLYFSIPKQYSSSLRVSVTDSRSPDLNAPVISRDSILYQSPFLKIDSLIKSAVPVVFNSFLRNGAASGSITFTASHYNDDYDELIISLQEFTSNSLGIPFDTHVNRFIFKGTGMVHGWFPFWNLHPLYFFNNNPYPKDSTYRNTDNNYSTGIPTNAFSVLSSGAYNIRNCYENKLQNKVINSYQSCRLTYFTSRGPTLDGRIKPDVITPGENVLSARSRWDDYMGHEFILNRDYQMFSGTSASSPITAGIAAMVWEKFPDFGRNSVIMRIKNTAYNDTYTSTVPNNVAGWGKADAFKALTGIGTDMTAACNEQIICRIDGLPPLPPPLPTLANIEVNIYPNPAKELVFIKYRSVEPLELFIYTAPGQLVYHTALPAAINSQVRTVPLTHFAKGIYFFKCRGTNYILNRPIFITR
ncbi:MAG: S8 family serine peptidase [Panacibacter sp.]